MKAVVFAYHDMGCEVFSLCWMPVMTSPLFLPIRITLAKIIFLAPWRVLPLSKASRYGRRKM